MWYLMMVDVEKKKREAPSKHFNHIASCLREWPDAMVWKTWCVCVKSAGHFDIFGWKKKEKVSSMCDVEAIVYLLPVSQHSLLLSVGWTIGFWWWMVREEHRQVTLLFSYPRSGNVSPSVTISIVPNWLLSTIYLVFPTFSLFSFPSALV